MTKKGLALTLATLMIWAVAVPAFAAVEPFPDVPQDHWAYEAIESLRMAGLVEGYPDGTFGGERTFTRYEMAMVFSRILERLVAWLEGREALLITPAMGTTITELGREFAPELQLMDVRVSQLERLLGAMNARIEALEEQMAELANASEDAKAAAELAERAADRAYRARLAAEDARSQARDAREMAERALAMAEMGGSGEDGVDREALDTARQADRLAYLAHLSAERALTRVDELEHDVAELKARPVFSGEVRADYENTHASDNEVRMDPRDDESDEIYEEDLFETSVALTATMQPADGVVVDGGLKLVSDMFGLNSASLPDNAVRLADLFVKVTAPGTLRMAYFGSLEGEEVGRNFSDYVLDADKYDDEVASGGAIVETQVGNLNTRVIAGRIPETDALGNVVGPGENVYGVASVLPLADILNVGVGGLWGQDVESTMFVGASGANDIIGYDFTYATYGDDVATVIDSSAEATLGKVDVGLTYRYIGDDYDNAALLGRELDPDEGDLLPGNKEFVLSASMPVMIATALYENGYEATVDDSDFTSWHLLGVEDADLFGFNLAAYLYGDKKDGNRETSANRFELSRTIKLGVPVTFNFTQAAIDLTGYVGGSGQDEYTHRAFGVGVNDLALTDSVAVNAGFTRIDNPLDEDDYDWTEVEAWDLYLEDDANNQHRVHYRDVMTAGLRFAATDALTLSGQYTLERNDLDGAPRDVSDLAQQTIDLGADYTLSLYGADVTLGYGYQIVKVDAANHVTFPFDDSPKSTFSVNVTRDVLGATMDASYKLVTGRGSDGPGKVSARDMMASLDFTYPVAEDMDFTLSGKWGQSKDNTPSADDYYYASVKAGVGLKF